MASHGVAGSARAFLRKLSKFTVALPVGLVLFTGISVRDTQRVDAAFHLAHMDEVMFGYGGDPSIQFVDIKMDFAGQNIVRGSRLSAWNADGSFFGVILEVPASPTITGNANGHWLMASTGYAAASGVNPDFTFPPVSLQATGMICWGAPGVVPEFPPTWAADNPLNYVHCIPYGGYTGAPPGTIRHGPATALGLGDGAFGSLQRSAATDNASIDFPALGGYACPTPQSNNNGIGFNHDGNFIEFGALKAFDDLTYANSDATGDGCGDTDDDNDGRSDADETGGIGCAGAVTNPNKGDTDGDNFLDGAECAIGTDPTNIAIKPTTPQCNVLAGSPVNTDADADGIPASREVCFYNTDPNNINTDGDACRDGREVASVNTNTSVDVLDLGAIAAEAMGPYTLPGSVVKVDFDSTKNGGIDVLDLQFVAARAGSCP